MNGAAAMAKFTEEDFQVIGEYMKKKFPVLMQKSVRETKGAKNEDLLERVVRVEEELKNQRELMLQGFKMMDKRFEQVDKRFEEMQKNMDKRFEQVDRRFEEMQHSMDKRFEQVDKRFEEVQHSMDKRFAEMQGYLDKRFSSMTRVYFGSLGFCTAVIGALIGFLR